MKTNKTGAKVALAIKAKVPLAITNSKHKLCPQAVTPPTIDATEAGDTKLENKDAKEKTVTATSSPICWRSHVDSSVHPFLPF